VYNKKRDLGATIGVKTRPLERLSFKVANSDEREQALALQREVYAGDVGHVPSDAFDESAHYLVAVDSTREVIGMFRMVGPEHRPFDLERFVDLSAHIAPERQVALIGRLCIREDHRDVSRSFNVPIGLFQLALRFSGQHGFTDLIMYTFPHLLNFYRTAYFQCLNLSFAHPGYGCEMHVMRLDLVDVAREYVHSAEPMARLLFGRKLPNVLL